MKRGVFDWPAGMMPADRMNRALDEYGPYAAKVYFFDYGEPLLNPRIFDFIRRAKGMQACTVVSSNLSLARLDAEALVLSGLDCWVVSHDGVTQETYEIFRRGGKIDLVYQNIQNIVAAKKRLGRNTPVLNWQYLVFEHNQHELARSLELGRELQMNQINVTKPYDVS